MVDFNNETTITRPRQDVVNFIILQRRQDTLDKYIEYKTSSLKQGIDNMNKLATFQAYLTALLEEIRSMLESKGWTNIKNNPYKDTTELIQSIESTNPEKILQAWRFIDSYLYSKGLTKTDTKDIIDMTDIEEDNASEEL